MGINVYHVYYLSFKSTFKIMRRRREPNFSFKEICFFFSVQIIDRTGKISDITQKDSRALGD